MTEFVTLRLWSLMPGFDEQDLLSLVQDKIAPAYGSIDGCLGIELHRVREQAEYLAITRWLNREAYDAWAGENGAAWSSGYGDVLRKWDAMMVLKAEWGTDRLL